MIKSRRQWERTERQWTSKWNMETKKITNVPLEKEQKLKSLENRWANWNDEDKWWLGKIRNLSRKFKWSKEIVSAIRIKVTHIIPVGLC